MSGEILSYVSSNCIFYLLMVRNLLIDFALFYLLFNRIRMQAGLLFLVGVLPAFWKKTTPRAYKILCKESETKRRARIGIYKKMYRFIEKKVNAL
ncbi:MULTISPECIES: hypothetical protein [Bacillus cereus group]|uniref:Uncharacterized protein n=1 Tax=Bacillus thuringiensis TaxID=1428 RepID=A0A9X7FSS5_BACTU|nr:hypothetical protein [Bacillus thuringiensis]MCQ6333279.1 hypothetical protein [Bacillus cereus]MCU7678768.1 hypothetical protein [Bacillus thuringiensis]PFT36282.1 hypothetical protein COK72_30860 [Bacillus thuringiensis]PQQ48645.1 hypothetical protein C6A34_10205 [Bacillus thuringiensis]